MMCWAGSIASACGSRFEGRKQETGGKQMTTGKIAALAVMLATASHAPALAEASPALKAEVAAGVEARTKLAQQMVDQVFSFAEPGFQEFKTSEYLTDILEKNGFTVTRGVAGIPTAFTATWGEGGPM
jgi:aminobenzoyl-glutamate utilization protein B